MNGKHLQHEKGLSCSAICRLLIISVLFGAALAAFSCRGPADVKTTAAVQPEPNAGLAEFWWPPQRNVWTPIGWKDHFFRFSVLYNGTVIAQTHMGRESTKKWDGLGVQLTVTPSESVRIPEPHGPEPYQLSDNPDCGVGNQGWTENPTPVLWTEWPISNHGLVMRKEIFAHIPGAGDIESGIEPLYAWIRLSVAHVDEIKAPENFSFMIHLGRVHIRHTMRQEDNLKVFPDRSGYPRKLVAEDFSGGSLEGCLVLEGKDKKIRLVGVSPDPGTFAFMAGKPSPGDKGRDYYLGVTLPVQKGAYADILLPIMPGEPGQVEAELELGLEKALAQSDEYWSVVPVTASRIETPERKINEAVGKSLKFAEVIAERNPATGEYSFLSGSWCYARLWPTPTSMVAHMMLDKLGYHKVVEKHIEIFKENQGTVKPPGESYELHPGYFSSPKTLTSIDWLADHGAILYEVSKHALLTGDRAFTDQWLDAIIAGCEFIKESRAITDHDGVPGVLPPAIATDRKIPTQSVWNIGWNYKGLSTAVRLLKKINHPRAGEFAMEARDYRDTFVRAYRERTDTAPRWTGRDGKRRPLVPLTLSGGMEDLHAFVLDSGPMFLVWSGLMEAGDELMRSSVAFFREGPNTRVYDPRRNCWQRPVLVHEISSCEPCYSWNVYHSWQLGDRYRFLEGLYSLLAGSLSRQTYISCETRHGIYGNIFASPLLVDLVRLSVVDDIIAKDELHLLRLVPTAWLKTDFETKFERMPTEFGPVTVRFKLTEGGKALDVSFSSGFRIQPKKIVLHVPPVHGLEKVIINGRPVEAVPGDLIPVE
ncbi:MAG: hypothetical protein U9N45_00310 [Gemmatimonadota bacterium]|nr:hypothetical protein [Gemmatimonadota bacterium]